MPTIQQCSLLSRPAAQQCACTMADSLEWNSAHHPEMLCLSSSSPMQQFRVARNTRMKEDSASDHHSALASLSSTSAAVCVHTYGPTKTAPLPTTQQCSLFSRPVVQWQPVPCGKRSPANTYTVIAFPTYLSSISYPSVVSGGPFE